MRPQIDVIIPNWNGRKWLGGCLESLREQTFKDFQVIVVDNGSTDGSVDYIRSEFKEVQVIALPENIGFVGGVNVGIKSSTAPYICWFNNDAEAASDFLEHLLNGLKARETAGFKMAAARVLFYDKQNVVNSAGCFVGPDGVGRDRGFQQPDGLAFDVSLEVFGPAGVAALYSRSIFDSIGLLDKDFFLYSEDIDLNYRAQLYGFRCIYVPNACVLHRGSASSRRISAKATRLASRNSLLTIIKNIPTSLLLQLLPWIIAGQFYQIILFARQGNLFPALLGKLQVLFMLPATLAKRHRIQRQSKIKVAQFKRQMRLGRNTPRFLQRGRRA